MDFLEETGRECEKHIDTPIDPNAKLLPNQREPLSDSGRYKMLIEKLNFLRVTRPHIPFAILIIS